MKLAVFSDVHANLHALEAVYCLGDLVGYGAQPNGVIDFIRTHDIPTIMGNYDEGVGFDLDDCGCVYKDPDDDRRGQESLHWSRAHTTPENKQYLRGLPMNLRLDLAGLHLLLVHGSPRKINEYLYADRPAATFERIAEVAGCDVLLFGHTHLPFQKWVGRTLFVNTGSVGRPKDGDPRAGYVTLNLGPRPTVTFHRVAYDVAAAARAIRETGLPPHFADVLETGGLPPAASTQGVLW